MVPGDALDHCLEPRTFAALRAERPGNVRVGSGGRLVVTGWDHANGLPPAWELSAALVNWAVNPGGGVNAAGARALVDGYRARAGYLAGAENDVRPGYGVGTIEPPG
jgi:hypothetical protein